MVKRSLALGAIYVLLFSLTWIMIWAFNNGLPLWEAGPAAPVAISRAIMPGDRIGTCEAGLQMDATLLPMVRTTGFSDQKGFWGDYLQEGDCAVPQSLVYDGTLHRDDYIVLTGCWLLPMLPRVYRVRDVCGTDALDLWTFWEFDQSRVTYWNVRCWLLKLTPVKF